MLITHLVYSESKSGELACSPWKKGQYNLFFINCNQISPCLCLSPFPDITCKRLNLILYHTEDKNIEHRQELYLEEGKVYYDGNLFVPDDLDVIEL